MNLPFALAAAVALAATFMTVTRRNAVHALLYFIVSLFSVAVIFLLLGAPFVAALEIIVYAGAIMVLFVFVVMLIGAEEAGVKPTSWIGPAALAMALFAVIASVILTGAGEPLPVAQVGPREVGFTLFGPYLLGTEVASFILVSGLIGRRGGS
jgi:NADH-quinone oxidoreductase subunit J